LLLSIFQTSYITSNKLLTKRLLILSRFYLYPRYYSSEKATITRCKYYLESLAVNRDGRRSCITITRE